MPIQIIKQPKPYSPEYGDILYGAEYVEKEVKKEDINKVIPIGARSSYIWESLEGRFGIEVASIRDELIYGCPWSDNRYYWCLPEWLVLRENDVNYYKELDTPLKTFGYYWDTEWWLRVFRGEVLNRVISTFLGHGYTSGTLPSDGSGEIKPVLIGLDNGDALYAHCWI